MENFSATLDLLSLSYLWDIQLEMWSRQVDTHTSVSGERSGCRSHSVNVWYLKITNLNEITKGRI